MANKQDFGLKIVEEGLAMVSLIGNEKRLPANMQQIQDAEKVAKAKELGIWSKNLKLVASSEQKGKYSYLQEITVEVTDVVDASLFHARVIGKDNAKIDIAMEHFNAASAEELEKPILKGTICAARFSVDKKWYRCRVVGTVAKDAISVQFIDYGNTEVIKAVDGAITDLRKLPKNLLAFEP